MSAPLGELGEEAVIARVGDVISDAAIEGRLTAGEDPRQAARRVAIGIATGMLKASRPDIAAHSEDVQIVASAIARWLGISGQRLDDVAVAARLHDLGKLALPDALLENKGPLGPIEWVVVRRHTVVGEQILIPVPELRGVAQMVRHSHERWDGFGYPDGLAGEAIPLGSRIVACADAFVSIRSDRPYRPGSSTAEALDEIRDCASTQFDPAVVEALEALADGLRIAADRAQPHRGAGRLLALLLIVGLGTVGSALARSGAIPAAGTSHAVPAPAGTSGGIRLAPPSLASSPLTLRPRPAPRDEDATSRSHARSGLDAGGGRGAGAATAAGDVGPTHGSSLAPSQTVEAGSGQGQGSGHDLGAGNGHGVAPGQAEQAGGSGNAGGQGQGSGVGKGHAAPPGHQAATPGAKAGSAGNGNGAAKPKPHPGSASGNAGADPPGNGNGHR